LSAAGGVAHHAGREHFRRRGNAAAAAAAGIDGHSPQLVCEFKRVHDGCRGSGVEDKKVEWLKRSDDFQCVDCVDSLFL